MKTNTKDRLPYYLRTVQALQRNATRCRVLIDYRPDEGTLHVDIGPTPIRYCQFLFKRKWAVADMNHNQLERLKALWENYEAN